MKLLTANQIRELDAYTIQHEPVASLDLMERAAGCCVQWLEDHFPEQALLVLCGNGNNGGDGLAIARMLSGSGRIVNAWIAGNPNTGSDDFKANYERLAVSAPGVTMVRVDDLNIPAIPEDVIIVDALFGTGLTRPVEGWRARLINAVNARANLVISIDIPSGTFADWEEAAPNVAIQADHTLTFQVPKRSMLVRESGHSAGRMHVLDIGLDEGFHLAQDSDYYWTTAASLKPLWKHRKTFEHKGNRGHLQIVAGSKGKMGAAVLASKAALQTGCGLVTAHVPSSGLDIIQTAAPEAMASPDQMDDHISHLNVDARIDALAIGPGLGTHPDTSTAVLHLLRNSKLPLVLDADGLNLLAAADFDLSVIAGRAVLTPHPKEFDRLFGAHSSSFERLQTLQTKAREYGVVLVLKGAYTRIALPDGRVYFNSTGNPGMATAGSGDVLTGMVGSLLAQGYDPDDAARMGVYLHGAAGDAVAHSQGVQVMTAGELISGIPQAIRALS